jgi:hypothetical protein
MDDFTARPYRNCHFTMVMFVTLGAAHHEPLVMRERRLTSSTPERLLSARRRRPARRAFENGGDGA